MKNKKRLIIVVALVLLVVGLVFVFSLRKGKDLSSDNKNIIGEQDITKTSYGYPLIKVVYYNSTKVTIEAGIYRFGDINQDGVVGQQDLDVLRIMIGNDNVGFNDGQIKLADVNEDDFINEDDIELFAHYLKNNGEVKYSVNSDLLAYCIASINDNNSCSWQQNSSFNLGEFKDYFVFVKQINNNRISDGMRLELIDFSKYKE